MSKLLIVFVKGFGWKAVIANEPYIVYSFINPMDSNAVRLLAESMKTGIAQVRAEIQAGHIFKDTGEYVADQLFDTTNELYLNSRFIVESVGEESLLDILIEAGADLLTALALGCNTPIKPFNSNTRLRDALLSVKPKKLKDTADWGQTWINYSNVTTFNLSAAIIDIAATGDDQIIEMPTNTLMAVAGQTAMIWAESLSWFVSSTQNGWVIWSDPNTGKRFGVNIHNPGQFVSIGTSPYYQIMTDNGGNPPPTPNWYTPPGGAAEPYTFDPNVVGYTINLTSTAGSNSLFLTINISDLTKKKDN